MWSLGWTKGLINTSKHTCLRRAVATGRKVGVGTDRYGDWSRRWAQGDKTCGKPSEHELFTSGGIPDIPQLQPCHSDLHLHRLMVTFRDQRDPENDWRRVGLNMLHNERCFPVLLWRLSGSWAIRQLVEEHLLHVFVALTWNKSGASTTLPCVYKDLVLEQIEQNVLYSLKIQRTKVDIYDS